MYDDLTQKAITSALNGDWETALSLNLKLLKKDSNNVSALNRTAHACIEIGDLTTAKQYAKKVLLIDPGNRIASNCLKRWEHMKTSKKSEKKMDGAGKDGTVKEFFIEEAGKTKVVSLVKLGEGTLIAEIDNGDMVQLDIHQHKACVCTMDGKYIGSLPDNIVAKMFGHPQKNDVYKVYIRSVEPTDVKVFIRRVG